MNNAEEGAIETNFIVNGDEPGLTFDGDYHKKTCLKGCRITWKSAKRYCVLPLQEPSLFFEEAYETLLGVLKIRDHDSQVYF